MSNTEIDTESNSNITPGQESDKNSASDTKVDAIASVVIIACLVAIAATFISGGLA